MANTTNLGLGKLAGTEKLKTFPSMQADNMDTLDTAIGAGFGKNSKPSIAQSMKNLGGGMAVLCDNNTHAAIPAGHYAYVMNHGTLAEGLYQNLSGSQIAANATLSGSNLTAVSGGGLNSLYSKSLNTIGRTYEYNVNLNDISNTSIRFMGTNLTNNPSGWSYFALVTIKIESASSYIWQIAIGFDNNMMERSCNNGTWNSWHDMVNGTISNLTASISITSGSGSSITAKKRGNMVFVDFAIYPSNNVSANTEIASVSGVSLASQAHAGCITPSGSGVRLRITSTGSIQVENSVASGQWIACSFTCMLA